MPLLDPSTPYPIRVGVHIIVFLFGLVAWAIMGDLIAPGQSRSAMVTRVIYTMVASIGFVLLSSYDVGFFFSAVAILTSGLFQTFGVFSSLEQLAILAAAFGIVIGSAHFFAKQRPNVSSFVNYY